MPWRVVGVCARTLPKGWSIDIARGAGLWVILGTHPAFRGPYLTSHHDDRTPPHTTLDDAIIWLDDGARGVVGDDGRRERRR